MAIVSDFPTSADDINARNSLIASTSNIDSSNLIAVTYIAGISSYEDLPNQFTLIIPNITAQSSANLVSLKLLDSSTTLKVKNYSGAQIYGYEILSGSPMLLVVNKATGVVILQSSIFSSSSGSSGQGPVTQGFIIDTANSDPYGAIEYCDDSISMTPGSIDWMNVWPFNKIFPCIHAYNANQSTITKASRFNPLNDESGNALSTADGTNHFTVLPLMWFKFTALSSTRYKVQITNIEPSDASNWVRFPYDTSYNAAAVGRYEGSYSSSRLGSRPGQTIKVRATRANFRTYAKANTGKGHTLVDFDMITVLEILYLLYYKNFNSQATIGQGVCGREWTGAQNSLATGSVDQKNLGTIGSHVYGNPASNQEGMKFLWIENFFGNTWEFIDGINIISYVAYLCHNIDNYADDTTTNYTQAGTVLSSNDVWTKRGLYTNNGRFLPSETGGSSATYYCDHYWVSSGNRVALFGGRWNDGASVGAFFWSLYAVSSNSDVSISGRLGCYLNLTE